MPIPIQPADISLAQVYVTPLSATPMNILKKPPEGHKCIPMEFTFEVTPVWLVNMPTGQNNSGISQICSMFVDASNSTHDVVIMFPDTGYKAHVAFGESRMIPCFTGVQAPKFYVILDDNGNTNATDKVSCTASNVFLPEFEMDTFTDRLSYGYGQFFELEPTFTQSASFFSFINSPNTDVTVINAQEWYITAINISIAAKAGVVNHFINCQLEDNATIFASYAGNMIMAGSAMTLTDMSGINYKSSGGGPLTLHFNNVAGDPSDAYTININIFGGVLVA